MRGLAVSLTQTSSAASSAWSEYLARFEEVDRSLGAALEKITDAAGSHATNLKERVGQIDRALGEGVAQLAGALEPLTTLRDTVEELAGILANQNRRSEEHTSELQSLMRTSYAVFCFIKTTAHDTQQNT